MEIKEAIDREQQKQESSPPPPPLMETTGTTDPNSDDLLVDAPAFLGPEQQQQPPSAETLENAPSSSSSSSSSVLSELIKTPPVNQPPSNHRTVDPPQPSALRRRRSSRFPADPAPRGRRSRILQDSPDPRPAADADADAVPDASSSTVTLDRTIVLEDEAVECPNEPLLCLIADFVIEGILFQFNLLVFIFLVPFRLLQFSFLMVYDPFGTLKELMHAIKERFLWAWNGVMGRINPWVTKTFGSRQDLGKLAMRFALGCFWSVYFGFILGGMLVTAFLWVRVR